MKNIKIVICDDELQHVIDTKELLEDYLADLGFQTDIATFTEAETCLNYLECHHVDLIFLDIFLDNDQLGTSLALKLRQHNQKSKLIFLSTSNEFATESFAAQASYYILKPLTREKLDQALACCNLKTIPQEIRIDTGRNILCLDPSKVIAIEVQNKYTFIHTTIGVIKEYCSLSKLFDYFQEPDFLMIHRSFIINLNHVKHLEDDTFVMSDGFRAPIKTRGSKAIRDYYMRWLFKHM